MSISSTKKLYKGKEFSEWATRTDLVAYERFVFSRYLDPAAKTLEAGCAGGRILYSLKQLEFTSLHGFDFIPEFIDAAKAKDPSRSISFEVQDAAALSYPDNSFDQLIYLAQIISSMETHADHLKVMGEAYRIAKPGGILLISFLSMDSRLARPLHAAYTAYLKLLRSLKACNRPLQMQPWLKHNHKINYGALLDKPPYLYYFKLSEIGEIIKSCGFELIEIGSTYPISQKQEIWSDLTELPMHPINGAVFAACRKPNA